MLFLAEPPYGNLFFEDRPTPLYPPPYPPMVTSGGLANGGQFGRMGGQFESLAEGGNFEDFRAVLCSFLNRKCIPGIPKSQNFPPAAPVEVL